MERGTPQLDNLIAVFEEQQITAIIIKGHTILDYVLALFVESESNHLRNRIFKWSFHSKLQFSAKFLSPGMVGLLSDINKQRNRIAHYLDEEPDLSFDDLLILIRKAAEAGIDFSDPSIHQLESNELRKWYELEDLYEQLLKNLIMDLMLRYEELTGDSNFFSVDAISPE